MISTLWLIPRGNLVSDISEPTVSTELISLECMRAMFLAPSRPLMYTAPLSPSAGVT